MNKWDAINGYSILDETCPSRQVLDLIADKWSVLVIHALDGQVRRYNELQRIISGISQKMLTQTLRSLEESGLIKRVIYPVVPPKVEYSLTELGKTLIVAVNILKQWAEENISAVEAAKAAYHAGQQAELNFPAQS